MREIQKKYQEGSFLQRRQMVIRDSLINKLKIFSTILASVFKSSFLGYTGFLLAYFIDQKNTILLKRLYFAVFVFTFALFLLLINSIYYPFGVEAYSRTLIVWLMSIFFYILNTKGLKAEDFYLILKIIFILTFLEFILINYTSLSFFEEDRARAKFFGFIRANGLLHNSSMTSALAVSLMYKTLVDFGLKLIPITITLFTIILLSSGLGIALFTFFLGLYFFVYFRRYTLITLPIFAILFLLIFGSDYNSIHPKFDPAYISFLIDGKIKLLEEFIFEESLISVLLGKSGLENNVLTSGDFGFSVMLLGMGIIPTLFILFFWFFLLYKSALNRNFFPSLILLLSLAHYPAIIDPLAAMVFVQYAYKE